MNVANHSSRCGTRPLVRGNHRVIKADTSAPSEFLDNAVCGSRHNWRTVVNGCSDAMGTKRSTPILSVLTMLLTAFGLGISASSAAAQQADVVVVPEYERGYAPILLAQADKSAVAAKVDQLWDKAKSEQTAGDYLEALVTVGEALGLSPDSAELLTLRDELVAQHEAELKIQRNASQVRKLADLARKEIAAGVYEEAQRTITRGLTIVPDDPTLTALDEEVDAALRAEAEETAQQKAENAQRRAASRVAQLESEARGQLDQGQLEAALKSTDEALALAPDRPQLKALRSDIVSQQQAILEQQRVEQQLGESLQQTQAAIDVSDFEQAQKNTQIALELAPDAEEVLALKQTVDSAQREEEEQRRKTNESKTLATEARHALAASELDTAQTKLDQALALTPQDAKLLNLESEVKTAQAEADAKVNLDQAVNALKNEAVSLLEQGEYQGALEKVVQALELAPKNTELAELATTIEAQQAAEQERQRITADVARLREQAEKQLEQGEFDASLTSVEEALALTPEDKELAALRDEVTSEQQAALEQQRIDTRVDELVQQTQTAMDAEDLDQAREHLQTALELAPKAPAALALKQDIENAEKAHAERERVAQEAAALANEAREAVAAGRFETAREKSGQALALSPGDETLLALQNEVDAAQSEAQAHEQLREKVGALKEEATSLQGQGEFDAALAKIAEATNLAPEDSELAALTKEIEEQQAVAQEQARIDNQVSELLQQAQAALAAGNLDEAKQQVEAALELAPEKEDALALGRNVDEAQQAAAESERVARESGALAAEARDALAAAQLDKAKEKTTQALALTPDDDQLLALQKEIESAQAEAQSKQQLSEQVAALKEEATTLLSQDQYDAASAKVAEATKLAPEDSELVALANTIEEQQAAEQERQRIAAETTRLSDQASGQLAQGQFDAALASVAEALTLAPGNADLTALREEITAKQQAALEQQRTDTQVSELLQQAQAALDAGDLDQAQQHVQQALALAPERPEVLALRQAVDETQQAAAELERAAREAEALAMEARADLQSGQLDQAEQKVTQALELTPDDSGLLSLQKQIENAQAQAQAQEQLRQQVATLKQEAKALQAQGNYAAALEKIVEANKLASEDAELAALAKNIETEQAAEQERIEQRAAPYIQRGNDQLGRKDVASARLYYEAAFSEGSIKAATRLGMTYDPVTLRELGIVGMRADVEKAIYWYEIAHSAGDEEASEKLSTLQSQ